MCLRYRDGERGGELEIPLPAMPRGFPGGWRVGSAERDSLRRVVGSDPLRYQRRASGSYAVRTPGRL